MFLSLDDLSGGLAAFLPLRATLDLLPISV